jgi:hypothetical protein
LKDTPSHGSDSENPRENKPSERAKPREAAEAIEAKPSEETLSPGAPSADPSEGPTEADLERAIVAAMLDGRGVVAEMLAERLKARRLAAAGVARLPGRAKGVTAGGWDYQSQDHGGLPRTRSHGYVDEDMALIQQPVNHTVKESGTTVLEVTMPDGRVFEVKLGLIVPLVIDTGMVNPLDNTPVLSIPANVVVQVTAKTDA